MWHPKRNQASFFMHTLQDSESCWRLQALNKRYLVVDQAFEEWHWDSLFFFFPAFFFYGTAAASAILPINKSHLIKFLSDQNTFHSSYGIVWKREYSCLSPRLLLVQITSLSVNLSRSVKSRARAGQSFQVHASLPPTFFLSSTEYYRKSAEQCRAH